MMSAEGIEARVQFSKNNKVSLMISDLVKQIKR